MFAKFEIGNVGSACNAIRRPGRVEVCCVLQGCGLECFDFLGQSSPALLCVWVLEKQVDNDLVPIQCC